MPSVLHGGGWQGQSIMPQEKKAAASDEEGESSETWYTSFYNTAHNTLNSVYCTQKVCTMTPKCAALVSQGTFNFCV